MRRRDARWRGALIAALLAGAAQAQDAARSDAELLRPRGPVTLSADRAEWVESGEMLYSGNVSMESDTLTLRGDRMTVVQRGEAQFEAHLFGSPAQLEHSGDPQAEGIAAKPVSAAAERIDYDTRTGVIQMTGNARLLRGTDEVSSEQIEYAIAERRIRAVGGQAGQVRIVIQPPATAGDSSPAPTPAPTATPGAAP